MTTESKPREPTQEMIDAACGKWSERSDTESLMLRNRFTERWKRAYDAAPAAPAQEPEQMARWFHDTYERLAPSFGYETRVDTRSFLPDSQNGRLMIAVCGEWLAKPAAEPKWREGETWQESETRRKPAAAAPATCRDDGRCQYAIDHGAEGLGHCPPGKCAMLPADPDVAGLCARLEATESPWTHERGTLHREAAAALRRIAAERGAAWAAQTDLRGIIGRLRVENDLVRNERAKLQERVAELERQIAEWVGNYGRMCGVANTAEAALAAANARLDWLDRNWDSAFVCKDSERGYLPWHRDVGYQPTLRAAIDACIRAEQEKAK